MPYRRLPNTDTARIKAMKTALEKGKELPPNKLAFSSKTIVRLQKFLPLFDHNFQLYRQALASKNKKGKDYNETLRKARIYLTHFIRVMNMAIFRGDLPGETRAFYYTEKNNNLRKEADEIILQVWNEVENFHNALPEEIRKTLSEEYGLVYFYRKGELEKTNVAEAQAQTWSESV